MTACFDSWPIWVPARAGISFESRVISARVTKQIYTIISKICDQRIIKVNVMCIPFSEVHSSLTVPIVCVHCD